MACKKDPVEIFGHGVIMVCSNVDFEEVQDPSLGSFLSGDILNVHVSSAIARSLMGGNIDSAFVVSTGGCGGGEKKVKVFEELSEIFDDPFGIATSNNLRFGGVEGIIVLDAGACKNHSATKYNDDTGDGVR
jgi:hypothetical protein